MSRAEAPVFILRHEQTQTIPGGAANCAVNLAALGAHVSLIAVAGDDEAGRELRDKLENSNVDSKGLIGSSEFSNNNEGANTSGPGTFNSPTSDPHRLRRRSFIRWYVRQSLNTALEKVVSEATP